MTFLETSRLLLREFTESDADALVELDADPAVRRYVDAADPVRIITAGCFWVAAEKSSGEFLGWFELQPVGEPGEVELGYRLRKAAWGKGYATEGARALIDKGFTELGVRRVFATTMTVNSGSRRLMEKSGLTYLRTFHQDWPDPLEGTELGEVEYELTREQWLAAR